MKHYEPKLICFSCKFGWGYLANEEELARHIKNWIPIICSGKIDTIHILNAFKQGADGVLILGCPEGDCHYQDGNFETRKKIYLLQKILEAYGIEKERLKMVMSVDPKGSTIPQMVKEMSATVAKLGPVKKAKEGARVAVTHAAKG